MDREKDLIFLRDNLEYLFRLWMIIKKLRGGEYERLGPNLNKLIRSSLVRNFLLGLANLLDPEVDGRGNENISIRLINIDLENFKETIDKIRTFRSKAIAHNDKATLHQGDDFFSAYDLKPEPVEDLLERMISALEKEINKPFPREVVIKDMESELALLLD